MAMIPEWAVKDPAQPLCIVHHVRVQAGRAAEYQAYVREHYILPANREPGCDLYDVWQDATDPHHFVVVERWANLAALELHMTRPYVLGGLERARAMQDGEMTSYFLASTKG